MPNCKFNQACRRKFCKFFHGNQAETNNTSFLGYKPGQKPKELPRTNNNVNMTKPDPPLSYNQQNNSNHHANYNQQNQVNQQNQQQKFNMQSPSCFNQQNLNLNQTYAQALLNQLKPYLPLA